LAAPVAVGLFECPFKPVERLSALSASPPGATLGFEALAGDAHQAASQRDACGMLFAAKGFERAIIPWFAARATFSAGGVRAGINARLRHKMEQSAKFSRGAEMSSRRIICESLGFGGQTAL
jgi:hypothetical protein